MKNKEEILKAINSLIEDLDCMTSELSFEIEEPICENEATDFYIDVCEIESSLYNAISKLKELKEKIEAED